MKRYIFYDKNTGQIVHTHGFYNFGSDKLLKVSSEDLRRVARRLPNSNRLKTTISDIPAHDSFESRLAHRINPKTGKLVTVRQESKTEQRRLGRTLTRRR